MLLILLWSCTAEEKPQALTVDLGEPRSCPAPRPAPAWSLLPEALGPTGAPDGQRGHLEGGHLILEDLDRDGYVDLVLGWSGAASLWWGDAEGFTPGALALPEEVWQLQLADVDGDDHSDLLVPAPGALTALLSRGGDFEAVALPIPPGVEGKSVRELVPGDADGDGDVDLYPLLRAGPDEILRPTLLLNDGAAGFSLGEGWLPPDHLAHQGFDAVWFDADRDGDQDLYVGNDFGHLYGGDELLRSDGASLALDPDGGSLAWSTMSVAVGDEDGDGDPDLLVLASQGVALLEGLANGHYADVGASLGLLRAPDPDLMLWSGAFADLDNDGRDELLMAEGDFWEDDPSLAQPGGLEVWRREGVRYAEVSEALGFTAEGSLRSVAAVDLNMDGVLDVVATDVEAPPLVYLSEGCTEAGWIAVRAPLGAVVTLTVGGETRRAWITTDAGSGTAKPPVAWFGLGDAHAVDAIEVSWAGLTTRVEGPIPDRREVRFLRPWAAPATSG